MHSAKHLFLLLVIFLHTMNVSAQEEVQDQHFDDWAVKCQQPSAGDKPSCFAYQNLRVKESNTVLLNFSIGYPQGQDMIFSLFTLPLGIWLPAGVGLKLDDEDIIPIQIRHCLSPGCSAILPMNEGRLEKLLAAKTITVLFVSGDQKAVSIPISPNGLGAALKDVKQSHTK